MSDDIRKGQDSSIDHQQESDQAVEKNSADLSRRKFAKTGLLAAPVVYTFASKPALGNHCTISGHLSGNLSKPHDHECAGCTPGYWGTHPLQWPMYQGHQYAPGTCELGGNHGGMTGQHCKQHKYNNDGTMFHDASYGFGGSLYDGHSMMRVIHMAGHDDRYQLGAHAVAALMNSIKLGPVIYGMTPEQVVTLFNDNHLIDPEGLKNTYMMMNERGCPLGNDEWPISSGY